MRDQSPGVTAIARIRDLHVYYGQSHVLQGVNLTLGHGIQAVVGRNGMGKTTLCKAIMGMVPIASGSVRLGSEELSGYPIYDIAAKGVGYTPQGRRLWPSLSVDQHLKLTETGKGPWTTSRIYATFPRLAERRHHSGAQLSGGEQQMLALSRALLRNPQLLVLDEPTEGLAPVIVDQVKALILQLADEGDTTILLIEQNITVATAVSETVAIMLNGTISKVLPAQELASDRVLQERLLGVGRHAHEGTLADDAEDDTAGIQTPNLQVDRQDRRSRQSDTGYVPPTRWSPAAWMTAGGTVMDPPTVPESAATEIRATPTRWSQATTPQGRPANTQKSDRIRTTGKAGTTSKGGTDSKHANGRNEPAQVTSPVPGPSRPSRAEIKPLHAESPAVFATSSTDAGILVVGTFDTKDIELHFLRDLILAQGLSVRTVDLSTSGKPSRADIPANQVASFHPRGTHGVFTGERGTSVRAMADAFVAWTGRQRGIGGIISAAGSGGTALATPAMRSLPIGIPKVMISTVASGDVGRYVGPSDIMMMYSVTDVQGINRISRKVLANGANALAGMVAQVIQSNSSGRTRGETRGRTRGRTWSGRDKAQGKQADKPGLGLTMFGVTTEAIRQITEQLEDHYDCLVFHATGVGGRSMEKLADSGLLSAAIDLTTTEICDMIVGGIFAADEDRFGAFIRSRIPYVGSVGALDMVNFGARATVPATFENRLFVEHNPEVTLMRTTPDENTRMGTWIAARLNQMTGPVRFLIPEGGISALDAPGQAFWDPEADAALFSAITKEFRIQENRRLIRLPHHINDPAFAKAVVDTLEAIQPIHHQSRREPHYASF